MPVGQRLRAGIVAEVSPAARLEEQAGPQVRQRAVVAGIGDVGTGIESAEGVVVNQTEYGNRRFLRTNVLSARPDLKKYNALRFRQEVKHHPDPGEPGPELVLVFLEAQDLDPPLTLVCSDIHLEMKGYPVEQGAVIEIPLLPPGARGAAQGFG